MMKGQNLGVYNIPMGIRNTFCQRKSMYLVHHMPPKPATRRKPAFSTKRKTTARRCQAFLSSRMKHAAQTKQL
jgi:hypothetical protein